MRRIQKVMTGIFLGGVLLGGIGTGTAMVEAVVLWQFLKEIWHMKRMVPYVAALIPSVAGAVALHRLVLQDVGNFLTLVFTALVFFGIYGAALLVQKETITMEFVLPYVKKLCLTKKAP